jgi:biopolymer transport protein ExbD
VDDKAFESLNVVPFIDIMLVLLVMVLTTASFVATGRLPVSLPQAAPTQVEKKADKLVELGRNGEIAFEGERIARDGLPARIAGLPPETSFLIRADKDLPLQSFVDVADALKKAKFVHVALQTQNRGRAAAAGQTP